MIVNAQVAQSDINDFLASEAFADVELDLTFLDPPFNQAKDYASHDDDMPEAEYWDWMKQVCRAVSCPNLRRRRNLFHAAGKEQRAGFDLLARSGWTAAEPHHLEEADVGCSHEPALWQAVSDHRLRHQRAASASISPSCALTRRCQSNYKQKRANGVYVTDIWDDIRELTAGYFAGDEALRDEDGLRFHKQQAPIALLLRNNPEFNTGWRLRV